MKTRKRNFKKIGILSLVAILVVTLISTFMMNTQAEGNVPSSFVANSQYGIGDLIANYHFGKLYNTSTGAYVYCTDYHKTTPHSEPMNLVGEASSGIAYILANGYPNVSFTGNSDYDYYITQTAVWWYLDESTGSNNISNEFKTGADPYNLRQYVVDLVNRAKQHPNYAQPSLNINNSDSTMHLSSDKKYYESNNISISGESLGDSYTVSLENAPSGAEVVNASNNVAGNSFATNESFKVRIPVSSVTGTDLSVNIAVHASSTVNKAYQYQAATSTVQSVFGGALYPETVGLDAKTTVNLTTSKVSIVKIDSSTGKALAGAHLVLTDSNGNTVTEWDTTENAHVIKNLADGTYTLKETKAPSGYQLVEDPVTITIGPGNRNIQLKFGNQKIEKKVTIIKVDKDTDQPISGAKLVIKDANGNTVKEFTSTTEPFVLKGLADGNYTVEEVEAPSGYKKSDEVYKFTISDQNSDVTVRFKNESIEKKVTIIKVDKDTGNPVSGAKLVLKDASGNTVKEFTSSVKPFVLNGLPDGDYSVEELEAPSGYKKSDEVYKFTISDENNNVTVRFENESIEKKVTILKVDQSTGNPLAGAHLVVKNAAGEVVADFVTTEDNYVINGISDGDYTIEEVEAPKGYQLATEVYKFTISDDTPNVSVTVENIPEVEVPFTGSNNSMIPMIFGLTICLAGVGMVLYYEKRQRLQ
ncbi:MAG TPA: Cys-Gln thioester bond-forming surface protein [Candidatus Onthousia faecigallinarum]|nr:Cys-Gln thioester bond-forming surface protein [Candidatus Onthousia faecigallinarum]